MHIHDHCHLYQPRVHCSLMAARDTHSQTHTHICMPHSRSRSHPMLHRGPHTRPPTPPHPRHRPGPGRRSRGRTGPGTCIQGTTFLGASVPLSFCAQLSKLGEGEAALSRALPWPPPHAPWQGLQIERGPGDSDDPRPCPPLLAFFLSPSYPPTTLN